MQKVDIKLIFSYVAHAATFTHTLCCVVLFNLHAIYEGERSAVQTRNSVRTCEGSASDEENMTDQ